MERTIFIAGGDGRQKAAAERIWADGAEVFLFGFAPEDRLTPGVAAQLFQSDLVLLPLPSTDENGCLWAPAMEQKLSLAQLWSLLRPEQKIFGAMLPDRLLRSAAERGLRILDYGQREEFVLRNASITAENALQLAMDALPRTLRGANCLVLGYGRIGKFLARSLKALGAETTVAARKAQDRVLAEMEDLRACSFETLKWDALHTVIFNTVPHLVLDRTALERLPKDCLCIDLASKPGGMDFAAAEELGIRAIHALGLPGKLAPESAGAAIWDTVRRILEEEEVSA